MASAVVGTLRVLLEVNAANLEREFEKATVKVGDFDKFTQNAGRNLNRMVESFSGQKIVAEAIRMAAAVEKVGGVSALTEKELGRVASTVAEATAKLRAMGAEVPPSIAKLSTELKTLGTTSTETATSASGFASAWKLVGPFLPIVSVATLSSALVGLTKRAFGSASQIVDLSNKTGLSTDAIQRMQTVADQTGTSLEAFTGSAFKLGVNVAEGSTKARNAVNDLGLEYAALKAMKPEDQFATVVKALEGVESTQERNRIGTALFGKQFSEIAASIAEGYSGIADAANTSTDAQLQALDRAADAWAKFQNDAGTAMTTLLGNVVLTMQGVHEALTTLPKLDLLQIVGLGMTLGMRPEDMLIAMGKGMTDLGLALDDTKPKVEGVADVTGDYIQQLRDLRMRLVELLPAERDNIDAALKIKGATQEVADEVGLSLEALKLYEDQMREAAKETKQAETAAEKYAKLLEKLRGATVDLTGAQAAEIMALSQLSASNADIAAKLKISELAVKRFIDATGGLPKASEAYKALEAAIASTAKSSAAITDAHIKRQIDGYGTLADAFQATQDELVLMNRTGLDKQLREIEIKQRKEIALYARLKTILPAEYEQVVTAINEKYRRMVAAATAANDDIVAVMRAQGVQTRFDLEATEEMARNTYEAMRKDGSFAPAEIYKAWKKWHDAQIALHGNWAQRFQGIVGDLVQSLSNLAQIAGDGRFGELTQWLATTVSAMDVANKATVTFSEGFATIKGPEKAAGFVQMAAGAMSLVAALHQATAATNKFQSALAGVMAMAGTGNPWLMLAGGVYGYIRGLTNAQEAQRMLGVQFRKDLGALRAEAQNVMQQAWVLGLDDDLQEMLATAETQADLQRIAELIGIIQSNYGQLKDEAGGLFDDVMRLAEDAGGIPDSMRDLIEHFRSLGILTDEQEEKLRTLGDSGKVSLDKMTAAADVIKARFESLGPAFNQQRLDRDAMKVVNALDTLIKGGADVGGVLFDAREEIGEVVRASIKFGTTVPANMKPWIDHLFETGNLLDENGDKITDISKIKYGEPLKTEAEKITEAFKTMTQKLLDFFDRLGQEILRIPDRRIKVGVDYDDSGLPPNLRGGDDDESGTFSPSRGAFSAIGPAFDLSGLAPVPMGAVRGAFSAGASPSMALADTRSSGADGSQSMLRAIGEFMDRRDPLFLIAVRDAARGAV